MPGAEKKLPQSCRTVVSLNAMMSPPTTRARKIARIVTTVGLPCVTASMIARVRPWPFGGPAVPSADEAGWVVTPVPGPSPGSGGGLLASSLMPAPPGLCRRGLCQRGLCQPGLC